MGRGMLKSFEDEFATIEEEYHSCPKDELMERILETEKKVVIFGAGSVGTSLAHSLYNKLNGRFAAFCDTFKTGFSEKFQVPIISPEILVRDYKDAIIIIAIDLEYNDLLFNQVIDLGFPEENIFQRYGGYKFYDIDIFKYHYEGYRWAYNFFEDDISRKIILDRIRCYLFFMHMEHFPPKDQYFEKDIMEFSDTEVFIDGGCYTGDTIIEFIKRVNNSFSHIYGFEPDIENYEKAKTNLALINNIDIFNNGLWDKEDTLPFDSKGNGSSRIDNKGLTTVHLISLDSFLENKHIPTFIKMDIEGAEKQAILGAKNIIEKYRPRLAVCVYHKPEDIYELTKLINDMNQYRFKLRHYSKSNIETVLYAYI